MSKRVNGIPVIAAEPIMVCWECGKVAETRPYGPNGSEVCFECGMKDTNTTERNMAHRLFGVKEAQGD